MSAGSSNPSRYRKGLLALLAASLALRWILVSNGGQNYWPDEARYERSRALATALGSGDWSAVQRILSLPDHVFFTILGLAPATLEALTRESAKFPALFFALFSVGAIFLTWRLMRALGESERASFIAALLVALSTTALYYARHLLPYDAAMAIGLAALLVGLARPARFRDSVLCGALAAGTFLTYNGYWLLAGFALLVHAAAAPRSTVALARRAAGAALGFAIPLVAVVGANPGGVGGFSSRMAAFARTASQGDYSEGWSLPIAYFWHAEHLLGALWILSLCYAIRNLARGDRRKAMILGVAGILVIYGGLVVASVGLQRIVVYGRLARQMVPFACILTALLMEEMWRGSARRRRAAWVVFAVVVAQASVNFVRPFTQVFPAEFRLLAARARAGRDGEWRLLFAEHIYPAPAPAAVPADSGAVVLERPHPLQFLPYQYEGYTPSQRAALRAADIRMRLVRESPGESPGGGAR